MGVKVRERKWMYRFPTFGLLTLLFSVSMAFSAFGGQFEDAVAAYERGDYATAFRLMKPLAEKGYARAQHNLGVMYDYGRGVPQANTEALKWYRKAAEQELPEAQVNLGIMYYKGQGVPQDYILAHMWLNLAASQYPASVKKSMDDVVHYRDIVDAKMTPAQVAEAQRLAREWKPKKEGK
ncbi:MAG: tetratricopeptide repeat protein [Candidatus Deferrimicrobiaceae bacterium]